MTNVANFGAFVDIGVHQDGLVHISALAEKFVKDPRDVVRVGQTVSVKVLEVDAARKRVALTMRLNDTAAPARRSGDAPKGGDRSGRRPQGDGGRGAAGGAAMNSAMADAFAKLKR
ncbi:Polyribonucleotide nucleotidyltransferase [compost metagenome]